ncbi:hypothetical protein GCM10009664_36890 [Kitasatospora gansuensis]
MRSGLSYDRVGKKANLSRSSVHRYCNGGTLPTEFGIVERIARVCGGTREEVDKLYQLWSNAGEKQPPMEEPTPVARRKLRRLIPLAAISASALIATFLVTRPQASPIGSPSVTASHWSQAPVAVPASFFGVTTNSSTGEMPTFRVGAVRLWDSRTRWSNIQARRGEYDWEILDRLVAGAGKQGLPVTFTMGGTPGWASPAGPKTPYDDDSRSAAPDDLADWDDFVRQVAGRYRGRIEAYELWVLANDRRFYSGSVATLVEMTRRANRIIKAADPAATVVCPSMGELWKPEGQAFLGEFAAQGGYQHCDAGGVKLYQKQASDPPETMVQLAAEIDRAFHRAGAHPRLWSTGTTYDIPLAERLEAEKAADFAVRFYLVGLYAQVRRMYFYNWGGSKIPIVLQPAGDAPTKAALYVEELQRWLHGANITGCGTGTSAGLPPNVWQCQFTGDGGKVFMIQWTHEGTARMTVPRDAIAVETLDGSTSSVHSGEGVTITERPILIRTNRVW